MRLFGKKRISSVESVIREWIDKSKDQKKTYVIAVIHKKNKKLYYDVVQLEGDIIMINKSPHYAGTEAIFYRTEKINKTPIDIPMVDVYEDFNVAVHPSQNLNDPKFSKRVVDMIGLKIEQGILENRKKTKVDLRKIIIAILIGGAAIYIIASIF